MEHFLILAGQGMVDPALQPRVLDLDPRWTADRRSSLRAALRVGPWCCLSSSALLLPPGLLPGWLACCPPACTRARARRPAQPCSHLPCSPPPRPPPPPPPPPSFLPPARPADTCRPARYPPRRSQRLDMPVAGRQRLGDGQGGEHARRQAQAQARGGGGRRAAGCARRQARVGLRVVREDCADAARRRGALRVRERGGGRAGQARRRSGSAASSTPTTASPAPSSRPC
jgi:hypothetical protein